MSHTAHTWQIYKYLPHVKKPIIQFAQNAVVLHDIYDWHNMIVCDENDNFICKIPKGIAPRESVIGQKFLLAKLNNTKLYIYLSNENDAYHIFIYFIKINKKRKSFDNYARYTRFYSGKFRNLRNLINVPKFKNIKINKGDLKSICTINRQTIYYRFIVQII